MAAADCSGCHRGPRPRFDAILPARGEPGACTSAFWDRSESREPLPALVVTKNFIPKTFVAARIHISSAFSYRTDNSSSYSTFQDRAII